MASTSSPEGRDIILALFATNVGIDRRRAALVPIPIVLLESWTIFNCPPDKARETREKNGGKCARGAHTHTRIRVATVHRDWSE